MESKELLNCRRPSIVVARNPSSLNTSVYLLISGVCVNVWDKEGHSKKDHPALTWSVTGTATRSPETQKGNLKIPDHLVRNIERRHCVEFKRSLLTETSERTYSSIINAIYALTEEEAQRLSHQEDLDVQLLPEAAPA